MVPTFSVFVLLLISLLPYGIPGLDDVTPALPVMAVFYWAVNRPDLMTGFSAFMMGLLQDLLTGLPLGVSSLVLLLVQAVSANQGRFFHNKSFLVMWWGFALVAAPALLLQWLLCSALNEAVLPFVPLIISYLITGALFPLVASILVKAQNGLLRHV